MKLVELPNVELTTINNPDQPQVKIVPKIATPAIVKAIGSPNAIRPNKHPTMINNNNQISISYAPCWDSMSFRIVKIY